MSNHPASVDNSGLVTEQVVSKLLGKLSGLPYAKPVDADTVLDWFAVLRRESVTQSELAEAYLRLLGDATEWIPLATIKNECLKVRAERRPYTLPLPPPEGRPITIEERDAIHANMKNRELLFEVLEGQGKSRRYQIRADDDAVITDEDIARRDEQIRRLREGT